MIKLFENCLVYSMAFVLIIGIIFLFGMWGMVSVIVAIPFFILLGVFDLIKKIFCHNQREEGNRNE